MSTSHTSDPDGAVPLSPREERILATIEDELRTSDPDLARSMTEVPLPIPHGGSRTAGSPGTAGAAGLLLLILAAALPPTARAVLGLTIVFALLPWLLLCWFDRRTPRE